MRRRQQLEQRNELAIVGAVGVTQRLVVVAQIEVSVRQTVRGRQRGGKGGAAISR